MAEWESIESDDGWEVVEPEPATEVQPHSMRAPQGIGTELGLLGETMWESVMKMAGDYSRGVQKIASYAQDDTQGIQQKLATEQAQADKDFAPYKEANPIASGVAPFAIESALGTKTLKGAAALGAGLEGLKYSENQIGNAIGGGIGGAAGDVVGRKIAKGFNRDPRSQRLYDEGLTTQTVGEQWGPDMASFEEKMASTPGLRGAIGNAKNRSVEGFHRNRIDNALREIQTSGAAGDVRIPEAIPEATPVSTMPVEGLPVDPSLSPGRITDQGPGPIPGLDTPPRDLAPVGPRDTNMPPQQELMLRPDMPEMNQRDIPADFAEWEPTSASMSAGVKLPREVASGGDAMMWADDVIGKEYDDVLDQIDVKFDTQFNDEFTKSFAQMEKLPKGTKDHIQMLLDDTLHLQSAQTGGMAGKAYREVNTDLRNEAKRMTLATQDAVTQRGGRILEDIQKSLKNMALRQNPDIADRYRAVERAFAKMRVNQDAATKIGAEDQIFSPTHYLQSLRKSTDPRLYSHGMGFEQKFAEDAKATLAKKIGNSGTTDRAVMLGAAGTGAFLDPALATAIGSGILMSEKLPQKAISGLLFDRPQNKAWKALEKYLPRATRAGGGLLGAEAAEELKRRYGN